MIEAARSAERAGAEFLVICTNTMHKMADDVQKKIGIRSCTLQTQRLRRSCREA